MTRRLIIIEGDGKPVSRTARKYEARATIYLNDAGGRGVELIVNPQGRWALVAVAGYDEPDQGHRRTTLLEGTIKP